MLTWKATDSLPCVLKLLIVWLGNKILNRRTLTDVFNHFQMVSWSTGRHYNLEHALSGDGTEGIYSLANIIVGF